MLTRQAEKCTLPLFKKEVVDDSYKFQFPPAPTGDYPYHLDLLSVRPDVKKNLLVFHLVGDTGSLRNLDFQRVVTGEMIKQYEGINEEKPQFLYHLGDIVYNHGEAERYDDQFFAYYDRYPGPVFAIPGNHDSDINPEAPNYKSLDAFREVFCSSEAHSIGFSKRGTRKSMTQPNVYWTLETPVANIIGLYTNVPKYGFITEDQRTWFKEELQNCALQKPEKALILCMHHAPFSADTNHASSRPMIEFLAGVFEETGVRPDIVFSGHVHNYQRFHKQYSDGSIVPFIVAGAGGFDELHTVAYKTDDHFTSKSSLFKNVELKNYCDDRHGFLKVTIRKQEQGLLLTGEYFSISHDAQVRENGAAVLSDTFTLML